MKLPLNIEGDQVGYAVGRGGRRARREELVLGNAARGALPDAATAGARWHRESDIPNHVLFRALEATAPG